MLSAITRPRPATTTCSVRLAARSSGGWRPAPCCACAGQPAQEPAQPHDALGVHAVERLVEQQHRGVAEHGRGHPEPLPHAQGVAARPAAGDRGEPGELEDLADAGRRKALGGREPPQVAAGVWPGCRALASRSDPACRSGCSSDQ